MSGESETVRRMKRRDTLTVKRDGEQIEVFNWATTREHKRYRPEEVQSFEPDLWAGDAEGMVPDAITHWLAQRLRDDGIRPEDLGVEVIDPTGDEVNVL